MNSHNPIMQYCIWFTHTGTLQINANHCTNKMRYIYSNHFTIHYYKRWGGGEGEGIILYWTGGNNPSFGQDGDEVRKFVDC